MDITNTQLVGIHQDNIVVSLPQSRMTKQAALVHAAWIVALADDNDEFNTILEAVQST